MTRTEVETSPDVLGPDPGQLVERLAASGLLERKSYIEELALCRAYEDAAQETADLQRRELDDDTSPHQLARTGWGVIFTPDDARIVRLHLQKLLSHRRRQARGLYKEIFYQPFESATTFLARQGVNPGVLKTQLMPYYLLIVGSPEAVPFEFQYQLSVNHAVGRVFFGDLTDLEAYAENVLRAETHGSPLPRRTSLFSVTSPEDRATQCLEEYLVHPLAERLGQFTDDWKVDVWEKDRSSRKDLARLCGGPETPGLLLVSCHGQKVTAGGAGQEVRQGALVCQDGAFHADDLDEGVRLQGQMAFLFACYGAGTPMEDNYPDLLAGGATAKPEAIARKPFVARLPQTLLKRGALAVVGHVDRGWTLSFRWHAGEMASEAVSSLEESLKQLLRGHRIGHALRPLYRRYTALAARLAEPLERLRNGEKVNEDMLAMLWTAHNDARNFVVLGDPAAYLLGRRGRIQERSGEAPASGLSIQLHESVMEYVHEKAHVRGVSVEQWINDVLAARAENDGFFSLTKGA